MRFRAIDIWYAIFGVIYSVVHNLMSHWLPRLYIERVRLANGMCRCLVCEKLNLTLFEIINSKESLIAIEVTVFSMFLGKFFVSFG